MKYLKVATRSFDSLSISLFIYNSMLVIDIFVAELPNAQKRTVFDILKAYSLRVAPSRIFLDTEIFTDFVIVAHPMSDFPEIPEVYRWLTEQIDLQIATLLDNSCVMTA